MTQMACNLTARDDVEVKYLVTPPVNWINKQDSYYFNQRSSLMPRGLLSDTTRIRAGEDGSRWSPGQISSQTTKISGYFIENSFVSATLGGRAPRRPAGSIATETEIKD